MLYATKYCWEGPQKQTLFTAHTLLTDHKNSALVSITAHRPSTNGQGLKDVMVTVVHSEKNCSHHRQVSVVPSCTLHRPHMLENATCTSIPCCNPFNTASKSFILHNFIITLQNSIRIDVCQSVKVDCTCRHTIEAAQCCIIIGKRNVQHSNTVGTLPKNIILKVQV